MHPEDLLDSAWLILTVCSNFWQNHSRRVHFLSEAQCAAPTDLQPLPVWDLVPRIQLSSLEALSQDLWAQLVLIFYLIIFSPLNWYNTKAKCSYCPERVSAIYQPLSRCWMLSRLWMLEKTLGNKTILRGYCFSMLTHLDDVNIQSFKLSL